MKAKLKNLLTGKSVSVRSTTDSPDSSYGLECWVDSKGNSYGQIQFGAPLGFALSDVMISETDLAGRVLLPCWGGGGAAIAPGQKMSGQSPGDQPGLFC
jgi:hypothetical protein